MRLRIRTGAILVSIAMVLTVACGTKDNTGTMSVAGTTVPVTTVAPVTGECASRVHFFADEVADKHFFGPPLQGDTPRQKLDDLQARYPKDPALVTAQAINQKLEGFVGLNGDDQIVAKINELIGNCDLWLATAAKLIANENGAVLTETKESGPYKTLYMISRPNAVPLIRVANPDRQYTVLVFSDANGTVLWQNQEECGGQPRNNEFPGIPPLNTPLPPPTPPKAPPPTTVTTNTTPPTTQPGTPTTATTTVTTSTTVPRVTTTSTVPSTTTSSKPPQSDDCMRNGGQGCPPNPSNNPVQNNPPITATPGAPHSEPPPAQRPAGDPNGGSGNGGAGPAPAPPDTSHAGDTTTATNSPTCPFGEGNC